jgi:hypothetical protein
MRALPILSLLTMIPLAGPISAREVAEATLYKSPGCECCEGHAEHLRRDGHRVTVVPTEDLPALKRSHGVPAARITSTNGKSRRAARRTGTAPSRSWTSAGWTAALSSRPSVSTRMWRLLPLTFLPAS